MPRLVCKTNPKQVQAAQEVDFEEEIANYKRDIEKEIRILKAQSYHEPQWIKEALRGEREPSGADTHAHSNSASSSSWEQPLTDSQAVNLSNYILTREEASEFFADEDDGDINHPSPANHDEQVEVPLAAEPAPAWEIEEATLCPETAPARETICHNESPTERETFANLPATRWPVNLRNDGPEIEEAYWVLWLAEMHQPTSRPEYQPFDDIVRSPYYTNLANL